MSKSRGAESGPARAFSAIKGAFAAEPNVVTARMFGSSGLKVNGRVFVMLVDELLVVKLPKDRVAALVAAGAAQAFDPGHGRVMREWVSVKEGRSNWLSLAREAHAFVSAL